MQTKAFLLNGIDGNILAQGISNEGELLKFGVGGRYLGKHPMSFNINQAREIELISILNVENELELAYIINNEFKKCPLYADIHDIIRWLNTIDHVAFAGRRTEILDGVTFNQYLYGFTKGKLQEEQLLGVLKVNG